MAAWDYDAVILGAGAAGLMAAIHAAERGRRVLLLEKGKKAGVKILMSGGTRCNITHDCDNRGIIAAFGPNGKFLHSALANFGVRETIDFFEAEGVATKIEETGKIFPVSNRAVDVLNALLRRLARTSATLALEEPAREIHPISQPWGQASSLSESLEEPAQEIHPISQPWRQASSLSESLEKPAREIHPISQPWGQASSLSESLEEPAREIQPLVADGFRIVTPKRSITAERVLVTTGGKSFPGCGTTGDGYAFATQFGHTIVPTKPALVPLTVQAEWVAELRGITLPDIGLKVFDESKLLSARRGSMLFAHFGLTGPAPLDVSRAVSSHSTPSKLILEIDLLPEVGEPAFDEFLRVETAASGKKLLAGILAEKLTRRVSDQLLAIAGLPLDRTAAALSKVDRQKLTAAGKRLRVPLRGTLGFEKAEVTSGGVTLDEVDSRTMQSKRTPGLYFAGEVLDLDGWIGGYNFQSAWSTGWLAGKNL